MKAKSKISTLADAVREVKSGMTVFVDGFGYNRTPVAAVHEIIRQGPNDLCIVGSSEIQADMLVAAGCVSRIDNGWTGAEGWPHGSFSSYPMRRKMESGELKVEYYTNLAIAFRLMGAAFGWSFVPFPGFQASDHFRLKGWRGENKARSMECPFTGETVPVLPTLPLDVAVIHAQKADTEGNVMITGPLGFSRDASLAAEKVIVTCEEVVLPEYTRDNVNSVVIPGAFVDYVVEVPWGAYPTACQEYYDYDWEWIKYYFQQSMDEASVERYFKEYVHGCCEWTSFLDRVLTSAKRAQLRASSLLGY